MTNRLNLAVRVLAVSCVALLLTLQAPGHAAAQSDWPSANALETKLYFGLKVPGGSGVSERQWARFLAEVVTPRFPDGLTVLQAYGQSGGAAPDPSSVLAQTTKVLIVVHADTAETARSVTEIKAEYARRFEGAGMFHTVAPVRVVE